MQIQTTQSKNTQISSYMHKLTDINLSMSTKILNFIKR